MTDTPDDGPTLQLPERPTLDARSAAALAINTALDTQLTRQPEAMVAIDPGPLADAVLTAVGDYPRVPEWIENEPRSVGGGKRPGDPHPDPVVTVDLDDETDGLQFRIEAPLTTVTDDAGTRVEEVLAATARVPVEDAEQWALTVLAACRRARKIPA